MSERAADAVLRHVRTVAERGAADGELLRRYAALGDGRAFAALVRRHGPLVLGVCRRVLGHAQDAEDAFQATFLVLARKARNLGEVRALGGWLHGVAYRMAKQAKRSAARRRGREVRAAVPVETTPVDDLSWRDVRVAVDDEVARLPERLRAVFVLCALEGCDRKEAARRLDLKEGTVWSRLSEARATLQKRLARRGVELGAALAAALVVEGSPALPAEWAAAAARAAEALATSGTASASAAVIALADHGVRALAATKLKVGLVVGLAAGMMAAGGAAVTPGRSVEEQPARPQQAALRADPALPAGARLRLGSLAMRHEDEVEAVALTPDGTRLVTAGRSEGISVWSVPDGKELHRLPAAASRLLVSPDGKVLASATNAAITLWDLASGRPLPSIRDGNDLHRPTPIAFTPDSAGLAFVDSSDCIRVVTVATGRQRLKLASQPAGVHALAFAADGKQIVNVSGWINGKLRTWNVADGQLLREVALKAEPESPLKALTLSPDGRRLALAYESTRTIPKGTDYEVVTEYGVSVWDVNAGKELRRLPGERARVGVVIFSADGTRVFRARLNGGLTIHDTVTGREVHQINWLGMQGWPDRIALSVSRNGDRIAAASRSPAARIWDVKAGTEIGPGAKTHHGQVMNVSFSADGRSITTTGRDFTTRTWDAATGRQTSVRSWQPVIPSAPTKALSAAREVANLFNFATAQLGEVRLPKGITKEMLSRTSYAISSDWKRVTAWTHQHQFVTWDAATGEELWTWKPDLSDMPEDLVKTIRALREARSKAETEIRAQQGLVGPPPEVPSIACVFSPDGLLALLDVYHSARLMDLGARKERHRLPARSSGAVFTQDSRAVLYRIDGAIHAFDTTTGKELARTNPDFRPPTAAIFLSGPLFGGYGGLRGDSSIHIYEFATGKELAVFEGGVTSSRALAVSPDGNSLVSGHADGTALVWDLAPVRAKLRPR